MSQPTSLNYDPQPRATPTASPVRSDISNLAGSLPSLDTPPRGLTGDVLGNIPSLLTPGRAILQDRHGRDAPDMSLDLERFLVQTYFDMAHCQYPFLVKHDFLEWVEMWRLHQDNLPETSKWKGFFVNMVGFPSQAVKRVDLQQHHNTNPGNDLRSLQSLF